MCSERVSSLGSPAQAPTATLKMAIPASAAREGYGGRTQSCGDCLYRRCWRVLDLVDEERLQRRRSEEEDLTFVGEMPEEGALGEPRSLGDLRHGGAVKQ